MGDEISAEGRWGGSGSAHPGLLVGESERWEGADYFYRFRIKIHHRRERGERGGGPSGMEFAGIEVWSPSTNGKLGAKSPGDRRLYRVTLSALQVYRDCGVLSSNVSWVQLPPDIPTFFRQEFDLGIGLLLLSSQLANQKPSDRLARCCAGRLPCFSFMIPLT